MQGILIKLTSPSGEQRREIDNMSDDEVLERLYKIQEEKKCLVVLDDVWRRQDWESLRPAFPIGKEGSRIVVTTRCQAASIVDPNMAFFHQPKFLTGEESWELLQRKALPTRNDDGKGISHCASKIGLSSEQFLFYLLSVPFYKLAITQG